MTSIDTRWAGKSFGFEPLRGIRYWGVRRPEGVITSYSDTFVWVDGENEAACWRRASMPNAHDMTSCSCGFHALTKDSGALQAYQGFGEVVGIVEGYGEVVEGTKGFRASKGRIVALTFPSTRRMVAAVRTPARWAQALLWFVLAFLSSAVAVQLWNTDGGLGSLAGMAGWQLIAAWCMGRGFAYLARPWVPTVVDVPYEGSFPLEEIRANYPGVKIYDTVAAMLEAHPLSTPSDQTALA